MEDYQHLIDITLHIGALLLTAWVANFVAKKIMLRMKLRVKLLQSQMKLMVQFLLILLTYERLIFAVET